MSFRTYHDVDGADESQLLGQVVAQRERVAARMANVKRVVAVMSGKGGVGKSYVTAGLALAASERLGSVGVLDADLKSPTVAGMLAARGPLRVTDDGVEPAIGRGDVRVVSTDLLLDDGQPLRWREPKTERFVWRGVLEAGALREFLSDVAWGALELCLVDLPPGADGVADHHAFVPNLAGAVVITIPTDQSRRSVERTTRSAQEAGIPLLGVIENMSGYQCADCGAPGPLFAGNAGAALAKEFRIPLLGSIPFLPAGPALPAPPALPPQLIANFLEALP